MGSFPPHIYMEHLFVSHRLLCHFRNLSECEELSVLKSAFVRMITIKQQFCQNTVLGDHATAAWDIREDPWDVNQSFINLSASLDLICHMSLRKSSHLGLCSLTWCTILYTLYKRSLNPPSTPFVDHPVLYLRTMSAGDSPCLKLCRHGTGTKSGLLLPLPGAGAGLCCWPGSSAFTPGLPPARAQLRIAVAPSLQLALLVLNQ